VNPVREAPALALPAVFGTSCFSCRARRYSTTLSPAERSNDGLRRGKWIIRPLGNVVVGTIKRNAAHQSGRGESMHRAALSVMGVFAIFSIFGSSTHATTLTGTDLLKICDSASLRYIERWEKSEPLRGGGAGADFAGLCLGYVTGVVQTFTLLQRVCPSAGGGQVVQVIVPLLAARIAAQPESGNWLAPLMILSRKSRNQRGDSMVRRCQSCREPDDGVAHRAL
jgi:hypothetical protein